MRYHDNEVVIVNSGNCTFVRKGIFKIIDCCVTDGQDPNNNIDKGKEFQVETDGTITFRVGRKKSSKVAKWWKEHIPADRNTYQEDPDELNFAMIGELTLYLKGGCFGDSEVTLVLKDVAFAQGSYGTRNNWWFGGKNCSRAVDRNASLDSQQVTVLGTLGENMARIIAYRSEMGMSVNTVTFDYHVINLANADWMKQKFGDNGQSENKLLKNMVLPASHDAGMSELHHMDVLSNTTPQAVKTQEAGIAEQLLYGCRFFDLRVDFDHGQLVTYHRTDFLGANGQSLKDIMDQAVWFLNKYKDETFIFKFSHIRDYQEHISKDTIAILHDFLDNYNKYFFKSDTKTDIHELSYNELKGKILIVCDYDDDRISCAAGYFRYVDISGMSYIEYDTYKVYDKYSNTSIYEQMKNDQIDKWKESSKRINADSYELFLLSWTLTQSTGSIKKGAEEANGNLEGVLAEMTECKKPHLICVDYVDFDVCDTIIRYNC